MGGKRMNSAGATHFEGSYLGDRHKLAASARLECKICWWVYDPALGELDQLVAPGTPWAQVPDSFLCPGCGIGKEVFEPCAVEACV